MVLAGATPVADVDTLVTDVAVLIEGGMRVKDACAAVVDALPPNLRQGAPARRELYDAVLRYRST